MQIFIWDQTSHYFPFVSRHVKIHEQTNSMHISVERGIVYEYFMNNNAHAIGKLYKNDAIFVNEWKLV